ncbi:MAG: GLUG motif-containing protein [Planctomycetota bacterium]|jgi:hypothetical protein
MKHEVILIMAVIVCGLSIFPLPAQAKYGGGSGEPDNPYLIYTAEQMNAIGADDNDWDKHFKLMADIDLRPGPPPPSPMIANVSSSVNTGSISNIIGRENFPFTGVFDGNGHIISNFSYTSVDKSNVGLFGLVDDPNAEIKNLGLIEVNVYVETGDVTGSLVGFLREGTISNCYVEGGSVSGERYVGGLVGFNGYLDPPPPLPVPMVWSNEDVDEVTPGKTTATLQTENSVSIMGYNASLGVRNSHSATIKNCYSTAAVSGYGWSGFWLDNCVGGLVGLNSYGTITNCYSTGSVTGDKKVGGLVGSGVPYYVYNSFWDIETSGQTSSPCGTGKTTAEMKMAATFVGWWCGSVWTIDEGKDYPHLWWENTPGEPIPNAYGGGSGEPNDPYLIYTAQQLNTIGLIKCDWDKHFRLMSDIDLGGYMGTSFNIIGQYIGWEDRDNEPFSGVFNGNGHTISNFTYDSNGVDCIGLFVYCSGEVRDLVLIDPNVDAVTGRFVGSLVGILGQGSVTGCGVLDGNISADSYVGGIVGYNSEGTITNCYSTVSVSANKYAGGLAGGNYGTISDCYSSGIILGESNIGGLVGYFVSGTMSRCYSSASIYAESEAGGLVGRIFRDRISECYSSAMVYGDSEVGGLVGSNEGGTIWNCYSSSTVSGDRRAGGLVGMNYGTVVSCYSIGSVSGGGGLIGVTKGRGEIYTSFWDIERSGQSSSYGGGTPKTTAEMQMAGTFVGWGCEGVWTLSAGDDYPRLWWENMGGKTITTPSFDSIAGTGDQSDPYLIYTPEQLNTIGLFPCEWKKHFKLSADIDLNMYKGTDFNIIGKVAGCPFSGIFDGNGHRIWNFNYSTSEAHESAGLFGSVNGESAEIKNLGIMDAVIDLTKAGYSGILVRYLSLGIINNCYVEGGRISGWDMLGGLVGINYGGDISGCYTTNDIEGKDRLGGLVGYNVGSIYNCYTTGRVSSVGNYSEAGGLVGNHAAGTISHCYSTGNVSGGRYWIGGLVGSNWAKITDCYATNIVSGIRTTGGLVGDNSGEISKCYSAGSVSGDNYIGGLVGRNISDATITNCYSTSIVSGDNHIGGLVGVNTGGSFRVGGTISNCYSTGIVTGNTRVGGLIGYNSKGNVTASFWDIQTSGISNMCGSQSSEATGCDNANGRTTAQMQTSETFTVAGWDFIAESANGIEDIWWIIEGVDYPRHLWEYPVLNAEAIIIPRTINLASKGNWLTCYIRLPEDYDVADIETNSIFLEQHIKSEQLSVDEQKQVAIARFSREGLRGIINTGEVELTITGRLTDYTLFEASDVIRVIDESSGKLTDYSKASNPIPSDGGKSVSITVDLSWTAGFNAMSHDVYFGTSINPPFVCNQTSTTFDTGTMDYDTTYYWRIVEVSKWGKTTGQLWSFTTPPPPPELKATEPNPADGAMNIYAITDLSWTAGHDAISHDVYFGTSNPPPFVRKQNSTTFGTGTMNYNTAYYWRIDEVNDSGTTTGEIWKFTTMIPPPPPPYPF